MRPPCARLALLTTILCLAFSFPAVAGDSGALRPGDLWPPPRQRGLNEVEKIPEDLAACPACSLEVVVPLVDTLMRRRPTDPEPLSWRMDAGAGRDEDLCPYPGPDKVAFQADVIMCPNCGYANRHDYFSNSLSREARDWVFANLLPNLREAEAALLGARVTEMTEKEVVDFFNRQDALPDTIRTEHHRTFLLAMHAPALARAEASLQAAWASRRVVAALPQTPVIARRAAIIQGALDATKKPGDDIHDALNGLQRRMRRARLATSDPTGTAGADDIASRIMLAGLYARLGFLREAEETLQPLYHELRERYLRPEQDPLWGMTSPRGSTTHRLSELEIIRTDAEREVFVRVELVRRERDQLFAVAECIRDAFRNGELDSNADLALFYTYMMGECLRRAGDLPLASEWFNNLQSLTAAGSPLAAAAARQLDVVGEEAGDNVNLLSALGRDGDLFALLRRICQDNQ